MNFRTIVTFLFGRPKNCRRKGSMRRNQDHAAVVLPPGTRQPEPEDYAFFYEPFFCFTPSRSRKKD